MTDEPNQPSKPARRIYDHGNGFFRDGEWVDYPGGLLAYARDHGGVVMADNREKFSPKPIWADWPVADNNSLDFNGQPDPKPSV